MIRIILSNRNTEYYVKISEPSGGREGRNKADKKGPTGEVVEINVHLIT